MHASLRLGSLYVGLASLAACSVDAAQDPSLGTGDGTAPSDDDDDDDSSSGTLADPDTSTTDAPAPDETSGGESGGDTSTSESGDDGTSGGIEPPECVVDGDCERGSVCQAGACTSGCTPDHACGDGLACCAGACVDIATNLEHCGGCDVPCAPADATGSCTEGVCSIASCDAGFDDCNGAANDGCEVDGLCECTPNQGYACYTGPNGTADVGVCSGGTQTCNADGTALGPCLGQTLPAAEVCGNGSDDDCDGTADEDPDLDGDSWTQCGGDCCDEIGVGCLDPDLVNPGAFEFDGNTVDDDCDGAVDNPIPPCDAGLASNSGNADDYARAMDLCSFTTANPSDPLDRVWGVVGTGLHLADGTGAPASASRAIRPGFGTAIVPQLGGRLAVLSTGHAADADDANPSFAPFEGGEAMGTSSAFPADWLLANGGALPSAPGCSDPIGNVAFNPVMFTVDVRVPTNAQSFSVSTYFMSSEYPEWVCSPYNDFFVALVTSSAANPADGNIAIYDDGVNDWPLGVNILAASDDLFQQCQDAAPFDACYASVAYDGCVGTNELVGTGFDGAFCAVGGGTGWLQMSGNVMPGEVMTLRFVVWDTSDEVYDSVVLLDDFQWYVDASAPGVMVG